MEVRDLWIKTLHAIMTRYKATKQQQQLQPGQPVQQRTACEHSHHCNVSIGRLVTPG